MMEAKRTRRGWMLTHPATGWRILYYAETVEAAGYAVTDDLYGIAAGEYAPRWQMVHAKSWAWDKTLRLGTPNP